MAALPSAIAACVAARKLDEAKMAYRDALLRGALRPWRQEGRDADDDLELDDDDEDDDDAEEEGGGRVAKPPPRARLLDVRERAAVSAAAVHEAVVTRDVVTRDSL
jgi:hypothetical protein